MDSQREISSKVSALADVILALGAIGSILAFGNFFYRYGWTGERQFTTPAGAIIYYGIPAAFAITLAACLKLKSSHKLNAAILLISLVVSMYAAELLLHIQSFTAGDPKTPAMLAIRY